MPFEMTVLEGLYDQTLQSGDVSYRLDKMRIALECVLEDPDYFRENSELASRLGQLVLATLDRINLEKIDPNLSIELNNLYHLGLDVVKVLDNISNDLNISGSKSPSSIVPFEHKRLQIVRRMG